MGYIIIDEEKLKERIALWNSSNYSDTVLSDVYNAKVDYACMLKALQQEEKRIDEDIKKLQLQKGDIAMLMKYANNGK
jgi:hypothetical protein